MKGDPKNGRKLDIMSRRIGEGCGINMTTDHRLPSKYFEYGGKWGEGWGGLETLQRTNTRSFFSSILFILFSSS